MPKITIYFECEQEQLGDVMGTLAPELHNVTGLKIETLRIEPESQSLYPTLKTRVINLDENNEHTRLRATAIHTGERSIFNPNWKSNHTTSKTQRIIIDVLKVFEDKTASFAVLEAALENHKFKASSRSPALTNLKTAGFIKVNRDARTVTLIKEP